MNTTESFRMPYETYAYLKALIGVQIVNLEKDFHTACKFISPASIKEVSAGIDKAHKIFSTEWAKLRRMEEDLHLAAQTTYKDHPNKEMRTFWGLK